MTLLDRLLGRAEKAVVPVSGDVVRLGPNGLRDLSVKAVYGGPALVAYQNDIPLSAFGQDWQARATAYLAAYRGGWFYKAGSRIARDFSQLAWNLSYEDTKGDNEEEIVAPANNVPWESLTELEQFLRLTEKPNPYQTGRAFRQQQQIRLDFTGRAIVYLEGGEGGGLPTAFYGISPDRMWQSRDKSGVLIGWVMDKNRPSGPSAVFSPDEILVIEYPGEGTDPVGVVESVYAQVPLTTAMPKHVNDLLATGGRLAGMLWPKERVLDEDEFTDAQRAWRSVTSDPNAARRLLLMPEPMEYNGAAASPKDMQLPELATLSRDEILTAFPIAPEMLMVPMATGLNSGQTQGVVEERYWSGTLHPRVETWEDAFQQYLIPRYEAAVGRPLDVDIEEPNLDDAPSLVEKVGALRGLIAVGFDAKAAISAVGLDHIEWKGLPDLLDPAKQAEMAQQAAATAAQPPADGLRVVARDPTTRDPAASQQTVVGKAITRDETIGREFPGLQAAIQAFLRDQRERITAAIEATLPASKAQRAAKADETPWWDAAAEDAALREALRTVYLSIGRDALGVVADNTGRVITKRQIERALDSLLADSGIRITDINETTRRTIAETLQEGVRRGYSVAQLTNGVAAEGYGGVQGALMANGVNVWDDLRAETIARTETMNAYNTAALRGYGEVGVRQVAAIDGDKDAECAERDGNYYTVDDALNITDHPNGTLDWAPITDKAVQIESMERVLDFASKAIDVAGRMPEVHIHNSPPTVSVEQPLTILPGASPEVTVQVPLQPVPDVVVNVPEQAAPVVNVAPADVTVRPVIKTGEVVVNVPKQPAPVVEVKAGDVHVKAEPQVTMPMNMTMPAELRITGMPDRVTRRKVTQRTREGISEVTDVETDA